MQSSSNSNGNQSQGDFTSGLGDLRKYKYEQPEFAFLLDSMTSQFLADQNNQISRSDFKEMVGILCDYLATFPKKIKEDLFYNRQRPDLSPRMDLALAYRYEKYRAILKKYQSLYGNNDLQNQIRIVKLLNELNFYFENATVNKETSVTLFERRPFKKTFKLDPSKLTAIADAKLPQPNSSNASDKKFAPIDGVRVTEQEIESLFRDVPEKYKHVKRHTVKELENDPNIPFEQRKVIGEFSLPGGKFISDIAPLPGPKTLLLMNFSAKSNSLTFEQINQQADNLEMEKVDEEIYILKNNLELIINTLKSKSVLSEQEQKFVNSIIDNLPSNLTRLQKRSVLLKNIEVTSVTHSLKQNRKPKLAPYLLSVEDEIQEVVNLSEQLSFLLEKRQKQTSSPVATEKMDEDVSLEQTPVARARKRRKKRFTLQPEEKDEVIVEEDQPKPIATPSRRSTRSQTKGITIDLTLDEQPIPSAASEDHSKSWGGPANSSEMSPPPLVLGSLELRPEDTDELSLPGADASEKAARKRKLLEGTQIEVTLEVKSDESKAVAMDFSQSVSQITRKQYKALCDLFNYDQNKMTQEIYKKYQYKIKWKSHNVNVIDDANSITYIYSFIKENRSDYNVDPSNWIRLNKQQPQTSSSNNASKVDAESGRQIKKPKLERSPSPAAVGNASAQEEECFPYNGAKEFRLPALEKPPQMPVVNHLQQTVVSQQIPAAQTQQQHPMQQPMSVSPRLSARSFFSPPPQPQNGGSIVVPGQHSAIGFFAQMPFGNGPTGLVQGEGLSTQQQSVDDFVNSLFL